MIRKPDDLKLLQSASSILSFPAHPLPYNRNRSHRDIVSKPTVGFIMFLAYTFEPVNV
jgi:hypothetical protein